MKVLFNLYVVFEVVKAMNMQTEYCIVELGRRSSVNIATCYGLDGWGSIPGKGDIFSFALWRPDRLWGPFILQTNGYLG